MPVVIGDEEEPLLKNNNNKQRSFSDPTTKPPNFFVSLLVTIILLPVLAFLIVISVPVNVFLWLLAIVLSPFISYRLKSLEKNNWIRTTGKLYQSLTSHNDDSDSSDILIVGAGIGGLSMAHFLLKCGFEKVKVFEKHTNCGKDRGGGHGLISGRWCYDKMGMEDAFHQNCLRAHTWHFDSGRWWLKAKIYLQPLLHSNWFLPSLAYEPGNFVRSDMLEYLAKTLPPDVLYLSHELLEIEDNVDGGEVVQLTFTNGKKYRGSLLVGCDGSNSRVRKIICNSEKEEATTATEKEVTDEEAESPFYVDINVWWCVTPISTIPTVDTDAMTSNKFKWEPGPCRTYFESGAIMHLIAKDQLILVVDYRAPSLKTGHKNWAGNATPEELVEFMKIWNIPKNYLPIAKYASRVSHFAIPKGLAQGASTFWNSSSKNNGVGRIVMLGDAVHPTPHFFGQGANAAIQDAYCLTRFLCTSEDLGTALKSYTAIRKPPARDIISKSYILGLTETAGGITRVVRDLIFFTIVKTGLFTWPSVDIMSVRV